MNPIVLPTVEPGPAQPMGRLLTLRRCIRDYAKRPVTLEQAACLLRAAQGITGAGGLRAAPSAGALYPLEIRLVAGKVSGLEAGIYRYLPSQDALEQAEAGDRRIELAAAALGQSWIADAALTLVFSARYERTTVKYGGRGVRYVHMEVGHAAQNVLLMAVALGLGAAVVGAFDDARIAALARLQREEAPLYLLPAGHPA